MWRMFIQKLYGFEPNKVLSELNEKVCVVQNAEVGSQNN